MLIAACPLISHAHCYMPTATCYCRTRRETPQPVAPHKEGPADLREFVYELPSSWPPARVEGGSGLQSMTPDPGDNRDPRDPRIVPGGLLLSNPHTLSAYWQVQDGFGRLWGQNSPKSDKNHQNTNLFARDRRFCREKTAGGRLLRKPHTCLQPRHLL